MIRKIRGTVVDRGTTYVVLDVNGIGYLVYTSKVGTNFEVDSEVSLWTHLAVRENALDLYGFLTHEELEIFELLLTLPKIGPKSAIQILSQADIELLKKAVLSEDPTYLSKMSGIGKKSAEKIVVGLKDKFEDMVGATEGGAYGAGIDSHISDTVDALIALGYTSSDARNAVKKLPGDIKNTNDAIREALRQLS